VVMNVSQLIIRAVYLMVAVEVEITHQKYSELRGAANSACVSCHIGSQTLSEVNSIL
jgi:hypothetical protein